MRKKATMKIALLVITLPFLNAITAVVKEYKMRMVCGIVIQHRGKNSISSAYEYPFHEWYTSQPGMPGSHAMNRNLLIMTHNHDAKVAVSAAARTSRHMADFLFMSFIVNK